MIQFLLLLVAIIIAASAIDFKKIYNYLVSSSEVHEGYVPQVKKENPPEEKIDLVDVVAAWEDFKNVCEKLDLKDAVAKLDEIFPMLIKADKE